MIYDIGKSTEEILYLNSTNYPTDTFSRCIKGKVSKLMRKVILANLKVWDTPSNMLARGTTDKSNMKEYCLNILEKFKTEHLIYLDDTTKPEMVKIAIITIGEYQYDLCYMVCPNNVSTHMTEQDISDFTDLYTLLNSRGFYNAYHEILNAINYGEDEFDISKKANGDGWTKRLDQVFDSEQVVLIKQLSSNLNLIPPEYVYAD